MSDDLTNDGIRIRLDGFDEKLARLERSTEALGEKIDHLPERMHALYVPRELFTETTNTLERRISTLESWATWAQRLVLGAVILALVGLVVSQTV